MRIRTKLLTLSLAISLLPIIAISAYSLKISRGEMVESIGINFKNLAVEKSELVELMLESRIVEASALAVSADVRGAVREANRSWQGMTDAEIQASIDAVDSRWIAAHGNTAAADAILKGPLSEFLRSYIERDPERYGEIFVTDARGATVAMTGVLTDYFQADESWWEYGFDRGAGRAIIDDRGFDESVKSHVVGVVVPIREGGEVAGILKINFRISGLVEIVDKGLYHENEHIMIVSLERGILVHSKDMLHETKDMPDGDLTETERAIMSRGEIGWITGYHHGRKSIMGFSPIHTDLYVRLPVSGVTRGISGESWAKTRWYMFVILDDESAFAPVERVKKGFLLIGAFFGLGVVFSAYLISRSISRPIQGLTADMAKIGKEGLDGALGLRTVEGGYAKDEVGRLRSEFDRMFDNLRKVTASRDDLNSEISERKRVEKALKREKETIQTYLDVVAGIVVAIDRQERVILLNKQGCRLLGFSEYEVLHKNWFDTFVPERLRHIKRANFNRIMSGDIETLEYSETPVLTRSGEERTISWHNTVIKDDKGAVVASLSSGEDITEQKRAEAAKVRMQEALVQSQKMEAVGRLAGGIAHDFNNMMTAIKTLSTMGKGKVDPGDPLYTYFENILAATESAIGLTRQISALSSRRPLALALLDLNDVIESLKKIFPSLVGKGLKISIEAGAGLWPIMADRANMEQIIINLALNARDAMKGSGSLVIKTENAIVDSCECEGDMDIQPGRYVCLTVVDTGAGIDGTNVKRIFDPFFTTKESGKGTGLGLSVVYGIVKNHNGCIEVETAAGEGATFRVYLPVDDEKAKAAGVDRQRQKSEVPGESDKLVLLVEDEDVVRMSTRVVLGEHGFEVVDAADALEALKKFSGANRGFRAAIIDVVLPNGKNGVELAEELKVLDPQLPIILMSGHMDYALHMPVIMKKGFKFIEKPYEVSELLRTLKEIC